MKRTSDSIKKQEAKKEENKKEFDLQECFTLWIQESKNGVKYMSGYDFNKNRIVAFFNKKANDKQPSIRIYDVNEEGKIGKEELITLWDEVFKSGKSGLSGYTNENEGIIAFYNSDETETKRPYIIGYFKKN